MNQIEIKQKIKRSRKFILTGLVISIISVISSLFFLFYPFASQIKNDYFIGVNPILFQGAQKGNAIIKEDTVYIPLSLMKKYIDDSIYFDEKSNSIILTTKDKVIQMPSESLTYFINEKPVELQIPPFISANGKMYISLNTVRSFYSLKYSILKESQAIWIQQDGDRIHKGTINGKDAHQEKLRLRKNPNLQSPYTVQVKDKDPVYIENKKKDYYFVRTNTGEAGYIKKTYLEKGDIEVINLKKQKEKAVKNMIDSPIHVTWEAVYGKNPNTEGIPEMPGVNVVSPTWFELASPEGDVQNIASSEYVQWAKKRNYQIWGLFSNGFDPVLTHKALKDFDTRQKIIRQLIHFSKMYHLDGVNLDIENVNEEDGPLVTQFVREATPYFHQAGLIVSMDITFISSSGNWSAFYERDKLASIVDFFIVMAYDEHWATSPVAGSVASFPWVENNLQNLLEIIPNEKLLLGVPLYTRLWKEQVMENGEIEVTSKALSMSKIKEWLKNNHLTPQFDPTTGQNYAEIFNENEKATYKVWLEDEFSLQKRATLVQKYQLAGLATWSRYFADESAWVSLEITDNNK